jgi:hypothetical protein
MKTKLYLGVIFGITAVLLLTLNIWGKEWYKLIVSSIIGVIVGITIADHNVILNAIKKAFQKAGKLRIKIKPVKISLSPKKIGVGFKKLFIRIWAHLPLLIPLFLAFLFALYFPTYSENKKLAVFENVIIFGFIFFVIFMVFCFFFIEIITKTNSKTTFFKKLYNKFDGIDYPRFWWFLSFLFLILLTVSIIKIIRIIFSGIFCLLQLIATIPLFFGFLFKTIKESGWLILLSFSIVMGGLFGTLYESYLVGYIIGTISFVIPIIVDACIKKINVKFFFEDLNPALFIWQITSPIKKYS